ncbi:hypothetical protein E2C01_041970 [Portunus trituberculatus]|uniref:Uncharacterized protein n=1 Tax=Portunus trituberculatus TaxID=210409 RepID=A0A5B7FKJ8_PORTR|nr:hypothetical protein [Portunus trituberculatus]
MDAISRQEIALTLLKNLASSSRSARDREKFHVTSVRIRTGNHQPSWPTIPQILSVLGTVFTCASSYFFLPFLCPLLCCFHFYFSPAMCSAEDRCSECSHLSLLQFQAYVKDAEKRYAKEKKQAKSSVSSSEKRSRRQEPASEAPWASRAECASTPQVGAGCSGAWSTPGSGPSVQLLVVVERVSVCPLSLVCLQELRGFVGSQLPPGQSPPWALLVREKRDFMQHHSLTGVELTSGTSRPGSTPLVLPCSPLALEVRREQLGCSLGISNPTSVKLALPRRWALRAERWYNPEGDSCGAPFSDELFRFVENKDLSTLAVVEQRELESSQRSLVSQIARGLASSARGVRAKAGGAVGSRRLAPVASPLVPSPPAPKRHWQEWENISACEWVVKTLQYGYILPFHRDPPLSSTPMEFPAYREGSDCHSALEATVSEMLLKGAIKPVPEETVFGYGSRHRQSLSFPVARSGQPVSGSCPTVSASQGSTSVPLEVFAGTSCIPSMVSARQALADAGSEVVRKEALAGCS